MAKWCKILCLLLVLAVALSSLLWVGAAYAQSSKPSPPVFNARVFHNLIEFNITNQPFTNSSSVNAISYLIRIREVNSSVWVQINGHGNYDLQSNGTYTTLTYQIGFLKALKNASSIDIQMQAQTGYYSLIYRQGQMPEIPLPTDGYWEYNFEPFESSDWSQTQTVDLTAGSSSTPTIPELSWLVILPLLLALFSVALIVRHRKTAKLGK